MEHRCFLYLPSLAYRYPLLRVKHSLGEQYPASVTADEFDAEKEAKDENALIRLLSRVFRSASTKKVVEQLMEAVA